MIVTQLQTLKQSPSQLINIEKHSLCIVVINTKKKREHSFRLN